MWQCMHHVPGRIRFRVPAVRGSRSLQRTLHHALLARHGVDDVEIRQSSCSVVVYYQPGRLDPQDLADILAGQIACRRVVPRQKEPRPVIRRSAGWQSAASAAPYSQVRSSGETTSLAQSDLALGAARYLGGVIGRAMFMALLQSTVKGFEGSTQRAILFAMTGRKPPV